MSEQRAQPAKPSDGNEVSRRFHQGLRALDKLQPEDLIAYQESQLRQTVAHARAEVPFYQDRLDVLLNRNGDVDLARWADVPLTTRADLQTRKPELVARSYPSWHGSLLHGHTSGSTGQPVHVDMTVLANVAHRVAEIHAYEGFGVDFDQPMCAIRRIHQDTANYPDGERMVESWAPQWLKRPHGGERWRLSSASTVTQQLDWLRRRGRCYVNTMPSLVKAMALAVAEDASLKPDIIKVMSFGEKLPQEVRELAREHLGTTLIDLYSSIECGLMASQCPVTGNLHVSAANLRLEVLDEQGQHCQSGETGNVVATPLYNWAMPLIRYRFSDRATWLGRCPCGSPFPAMQAIDGRERDLFIWPDGSRFSPSLPITLPLSTLGTARFQLRQTSHLGFELRFVSATPPDAQDRDGFVAALRTATGHPVTVEFIQLQDLPQDEGGKHAEYVCAIA